MARGKKNHAEGMEVFYVKVLGLSKDSSDAVEFELKQKNSEGKFEVVDKERTLSGQLIYVGAHTNTNDAGKEFKSIIIHLRDKREKEYYKISMGLNNMSRGIINSLAGATGSVNNLELSVYTNKKGYASAFIVADEDKEKLNWKYEYEFLEEMKDITRNEAGKVVDVDSDKLDAFIMKEVIPEQVVPNIYFNGDSAEDGAKAVVEESGLESATPMAGVEEEVPEGTEESIPDVVAESQAATEKAEDDDLPF
jgi:hypothetical protein